MSLIREIKQNHKVSLQGARKHVSLVIKEYSQLDKLVFHKQLDVTARGLVVAGMGPIEAIQLIDVEIDREGKQYGWINERATDEIISYNMPRA